MPGINVRCPQVLQDNQVGPKQILAYYSRKNLNVLSGIRSNFATLTVLVPPDPPKIVQGDYMVTTEDREIELECISYGGKPAAEITWIDGHGK